MKESINRLLRYKSRFKGTCTFRVITCNQVRKNGRGHGDVSYYTKVLSMANQMRFSLLPDEHTSVRQEVTN